VSVLPAATPLGDRRNMAYLGTVVAAGKARAVVVATGMVTELGRIAGLLQRYEPEPTPLQRRLTELGRALAVVSLGLVALIFGLELLRGGGLLPVFLTAVSLAVAAVPEGLPAVVTIVLALGLQRMVRRNALVRKLPSVETLGSVTVICSDKTGTLTRNEMTVRELLAGGERSVVAGAGYAPVGSFLRVVPGRGEPEPVRPGMMTELARALTVAARCNHARVRPRKDGTGAWEVLGDPTEGALLVAALKAGFAEGGGQTLYEIPFESERKAMSVVVREPDGVTRMYTKGAPEVVIGKCVAEHRGQAVEPLTAERRAAILAAAAEMAGRALRVIALADRDLADSPATADLETDLVFAGLAGMIDPPRDEARDAVRRCHRAGIRPVMITGDHPATALAIARELGIAADGDRALTGRELDGLTGEQLAAQVDRIPVYARVTAEHKLRVVRAWKARGQVVAMTGDGVNDAPAVKAADIGIAMGLTGTDVTKEASAMVLTDDNFASIVAAVEEGRGIYDNIQKVLTYLLSCNAGEILLMLAAALLGWPVPLVPVQLLWINLVTDGLPALALALERPEPGVMRRPPRPPREPILSWQTGSRVVLQGALVGGTALAAFGILLAVDPGNVGRARTMAFCVLVYGELFRALAARSPTLTLGQLGPFSNPALLGAIAVSALLQLSVVTLPYARPAFESVQHFGWEWALLFALSLVPVSAIEAVKLLHAPRPTRGPGEEDNDA